MSYIAVRVSRTYHSRVGKSLRVVRTSPLVNRSYLALAMADAALDARERPRKIAPRRVTKVECPKCGAGKDRTQLTASGARRCECGELFMPKGFVA